MKFTLEVPFHYLPITCVSYLPGLTLICHCKHFQRSRGNCSCSFSICCLLRLRRVTKKNLLQVQKSYSISLSEHFQIHSSASLGDLMIFAREMIWQNSKIYVSVLLLNSRFSQSKITCLFFFFLKRLPRWCCSVKYIAIVRLWYILLNLAYGRCR